MPMYVTLVKLTENGAKNVRDDGKRIAQVGEMLQAAGGRVIGAYAMLGEYDQLWLIEVPDIATALTVLGRVAAQGAVSTQTHEIVPIEQWLQILNQV